MDSKRGRQIEELFQAALSGNAAQRERILAKADPELRREVETLLAENAQNITLTAQPIAKRVGRYQIETKLGAGGMGEVFRAHDTKLNRPVAIKFLFSEVVDAAAQRRFQREAETASSLNHPHILTVYDTGEFEGRKYLVTEFVDGGTLKTWAHSAKRTWRHTIELLIGVADGLAVAHAAGILHRDIKPDNILISQSGYAKLADFGLAKLVEDGSKDGALDLTRTLTEGRTRPGVIIGTIPYMSPEQAAGKPVDARSDIFSFGVLLYELLAGRRPFTGSTDLQVLQAILHAPAEPLAQDVPLSLRSAVEKALEKNPAERYQSMRDLVVDLKRATRQTVTEPPPASAELAQPTQRPRTWKWTSKWVAAMAVLFVVAAGIAWIVLHPKSSEPTPHLEYTQLTSFVATLV